MAENALTLRPLPRAEAGPGFWRRVPAPSLGGLVDSIVGYEEDGTPLDLSAESASLIVPLVISFGEPFEIGLGRAPRHDERYGSFTSGLYPGCVLISSTGRARCIQVDFTPLGARRFFGLPMAELSERMVSLDDLADPGIDILRRRLGDLDDWNARLDLVEAYLADRLMRVAAGGGEIAWAWDTILAAGGAAPVGRLASALGWSRKHLVHRFRQEIGLPPKTVARMVRFNRALGLAARAPGEPWAGIAADCGYADQAHLTREFVEFAGRSPGEWRSRPG